MRCPACDTPMQPRSFGPVEVDVCDPGCGGLWFARSELAAVDEPDEGIGAALETALTHAPGPLRSAPIRCTRCDAQMREHRYQNIRSVLVDECSACGGFFLDAGELRAIRDALGARNAEMVILVSKIFTRPFGGVGF